MDDEEDVEEVETEIDTEAGNDPNTKVGRRVAEVEYARFLEAMDLQDSLDTSKMDDEDRKGLDLIRTMVIRAIMHGHLVINENGEPVYTPTRGNKNPITFHEPTGAHQMAMDQRKKNHTVSRQMSWMAAMTKQPVARFANMANRDLKLCQGLFLLFTA